METMRYEEQLEGTMFNLGEKTLPEVALKSVPLSYAEFLFMLHSV